MKNKNKKILCMAISLLMMIVLDFIVAFSNVFRLLVSGFACGYASAVFADWLYEKIK